MNKLLKPLIKLWPLWIGLWVISFTITSGITFIFGYAGLTLAEQNNPHAFDHSNWLSFNLLNKIMAFGPYVFVITLVMVVLLCALWPNQKQKEKSV